ncbi:MULTISPECIES: SIMPL domain-containing protein [Myroides]|uniref:DUF541 domain-containing protein n=1 Tax=Myroides albus TaxID=2562892 RepID=A0A6I3LPI1_9FLAO|nr:MULTISPECIES: SIMPL domain-containing protein [Myroides]MTG98571.1 DUF541 domain-containing protein [Myroides albus]MVX36608.1 DUF541 domain-containing protein [Myroides sp. LoEW2-1]UVD79939.1 SIMPL domain-containing protein [Myroides albus]
MKRVSILLGAALLATTATFAQTSYTSPITPQIQVNGTGKVSVVPDKAVIRLGVENKSSDAASVKKINDQSIAKVLKYLKSLKIEDKYIQTQRVSLYQSRDYEEKKDYYNASQVISITLTDITKYEELIVGVMEAGVNKIEGVEFQSSKIATYEAEARALAVKEAKQKATDYANALGQKVGKAILVSDGGGYAPPVVRPMYLMKGTADSMDQTLAVGEIEVTSGVSISFSLD